MAVPAAVISGGPRYGRAGGAGTLPKLIVSATVPTSHQLVTCAAFMVKCCGPSPGFGLPSGAIIAAPLPPLAGLVVGVDTIFAYIDNGVQVGQKAHHPTRGVRSRSSRADARARARAARAPAAQQRPRAEGKFVYVYWFDW